LGRLFQVFDFSRPVSVWIPPFSMHDALNGRRFDPALPMEHAHETLITGVLPQPPVRRSRDDHNPAAFCQMVQERRSMKRTLIGVKGVIRTLLLVSCAMTTAGVALQSLCYGTPIVTDALLKLAVDVNAGGVGFSYTATAYPGENYQPRGSIYWDPVVQDNLSAGPPQVISIGCSFFSQGPSSDLNWSSESTLNFSDVLADSSTAEGDIYRVGTLGYTEFGVYSYGDSSADVKYDAEFSIASPEGIVRTYLAEYSVVQGEYVKFNDSGPLGGVGSAKINFSWQHIFTPGSSQNRQIGVFAVVNPVPEPSTCAMALAGLACGGYLVRRRRRSLTGERRPSTSRA
jgi:hypothetical protein